MATLRLESVGCALGARTLFDSLSCEVGDGAWVMLTGDNGSGKSTLLRTIAGLLVLQSGALLWNGQDVEPRSPEWHRTLLYQGHASGLKDLLDPQENLRLQARLDRALPPWRRDDDAQIRRALDEVGLIRQRALPVARLSAGQRRRVALARLVLSEHPIWLLDEPTTALDHEGQALFGRLLETHLERGGCAIVSTHVPLERVRPPIALHLGQRASGVVS